ncbi:hypothetical protein CHS0354_034614 [Potamilus streckersoni]|uniref:Cadherin domain-containing protein n=1 Tax=Potamilus streckersoni TaxID=2493646 RepID=A0AAE0ST11_9BIVA|nr:hypothetical protein CHS0354_034614 [Potamilus streckersoni]
MESYMFKIICILIVLYSEETEADCGSEFTGVSNPTVIGKDKYSEVSGDTDVAYMLDDPVTCCGVIKGWTAYFKHNGTIHFDIWRPTLGKDFKLVGTYEFTTGTSDGQDYMTIVDKYTVYPGDYIGWYTPLKEMVAYINGNSSGEAKSVKFFKLRPSSLFLGQELSWFKAVSLSSKTYAIKAEYAANKSPQFVNLDANIQVVPHTAIGTVLYSITASDPDISDTTITQLIYNMTNQVRVSADIPNSFGRECLSFEVQDICKHIDKKSLCIFTDNVPPTIMCQPQTASIIETTTGNVDLISVVVSDPTDDVTCSLRTWPKNNHFQLRGANFDYTIYVDTNPGFRVVDQRMYTVEVTCTDSKNSTTWNSTIEILPSAPPMFTNLPNLLPLSSGNVNQEIVYTVSVTDPDSTSFDFSMTCKPSPCPFSIYNTGHIQLTQDIITLNAGGYQLNITVTDGYHNISSYLTVIYNANLYPKFTNLPAELTIEENTPRGTSIYTVTATDNNRDTLTYSMKSSPQSGMSYFSIDIFGGLISTSVMKSIDYETMETFFKFTVTVTDGIIFVSQSLTINVTNVNEEPSFSQNTYRIVANESKANTILPDPNFIVNDVDDGDTHLFKLDCLANNGYFTMNDTTGILRFAVDYDLDVPGKLRLITCVVTATDRGGLSATAMLSITINEINDNSPKFKKSLYKFSVYRDSAIGLVIGRISATDADIGNNGEIIYSTDPTENLFDVSLAGHITRQGYNVIQNHGFKVYATDSGSPAQTGTASVTVIIMEPTSTASSSTTTGYKTFIEDKRNMVWIVFLALLALITTLLTVWLCWTSIRSWPIGFDPFYECGKNCNRPRWCKDRGQKSVKGSSQSPPASKRPQQPQSDITKKQSPATPKQQSVTPNQPHKTPQQPPLTPQLSVTPTHSSVAAPTSPDITLPLTPPHASQPSMTPKDDSNFRGYNFWREKWHEQDEMVI